MTQPIENPILQEWQVTGMARKSRARRLIVVSNRAPISVVRDDSGEQIKPTVGGVGTTFLRLLERHGGLWVAWGGAPASLAPGATRFKGQGFDLVLVELAERDLSGYYYGMCNEGLWPLMHFMTPKCHFNSEHWGDYRRVNHNFAMVTSSHCTSDDAIWIQDFHLALTPGMIRARRPEVPIAIFWHVPFPPRQVFRVFPWGGEFLAGMLGSDLIGFHTRPYVRNFLSSCQDLPGATVDWEREEIFFEGRTVKVGAFPLGVAVDHFESLAASEEVSQHARRIREALGTEQVVLGVDRLDYTKGIVERLIGFEQFLERNPAYHRRVTLVLVAVPSRTKLRDSAKLKQRIDENIGRVIGRFSSDGWTPIHYFYTQLSTEELVAYYRAADIALITPLRDGMNLVAKEYIAAHLDDDGVLILSEFAGAADELSEALFVNPYDTGQIAARLGEAIAMPAAERARRMRSLRATIRANDLERWSRDFFHSMLTARPSPEREKRLDAVPH